MSLPRRPAGIAAVVVCCAMCLLAACSGSSGSPAPSAWPVSSAPNAAAPTPQPSPLITSGPPPAGAVEVVKRWWQLAGQGREAEARQLTTPDSPLRAQFEVAWKSAHFVGAANNVLPAPVTGATVEFEVTVFVDPIIDPPSPFGDKAGEVTMFENVTRMSDGTWRLVDGGTGP
jgi:hypothetical protein